MLTLHPIWNDCIGETTENPVLSHTSRRMHVSKGKEDGSSPAHEREPISQLHVKGPPSIPANCQEQPSSESAAEPSEREFAPMSALIRISMALSLAGVLLTSAPLSRATPAYNVTVIGPFSQQFRFGLGLNNKGHVTGETSGAQAFVYDGQLHSLGKPGGAKFSVGQGISDNDIIAATAQRAGTRNAYAVTYREGHTTWTRLAGIPGYQQSEAAAILPDGSAITGQLCATGDLACSHLGRHSEAVVWRRSGGAWSVPLVLSTGKAPAVSEVSGIARAGAITVVSGAIVPRGTNARWRAGLWLLPGHQFFPLTGAGSYSVVTISAIAHADGNTFYVAGTIATPTEGTYGKPTMWTVSCTQTACRQTKLQVITSLGETYAVNNHGTVTGYDRSDGGAGSNFLWQAGKEILDNMAGPRINNSGQMVGWRINPPYSHHYQVILLTPSSSQSP